FSEFLGTAVLLLGVRALTDRRNAAPGGYVEPLALGGLVWAIGLSLGGLTGYAINPARDLGPRIASALLGWGAVSSMISPSILTYRRRANLAHRASSRPEAVLTEDVSRRDTRRGQRDA